MYIEEFVGEKVEVGEEKNLCNESAVGSSIISFKAKRVLIGAGARALFYPTLVYNVVRNKIQTEFRWWDRVDEYILLGAVPFPSDVPHLKELGVGGVITLNESYETLVSSSLYQAHSIDHLVIPTRDYCFAPSLSNICQAVDFIHINASHGQTTYVHCKAGRGRSTTVVICYLVQYKEMVPDAAYDYVKSIRPRVCLASSQWQAVQEYYHFKVKKTCIYNRMTKLLMKFPLTSHTQNHAPFDDASDSVVVITQSDLDGYDPHQGLSEIWTDVSVVYRVRVASEAAFARLSCLWLRYNNNKIANEKQGAALLGGGISVDIRVY